MNGRLRHYGCGSTTHDAARMFRGAQPGVRTFPSGAFLYDGGEGRRVLFDTGYATGHWDTGWRGAAYRRLLPPQVSEEDDIAARLREDGVDPASVTHAVLSHLHPDHVGGARRFPDATFVLTAGHLRTLASPRLTAGVLPGLLPAWFPGAARIIGDDDFEQVTHAGTVLRAVDLFDDGSYLVIDLPGHADGHIGALVEGQVLLAGDGAWGCDLLDAAPRMKALPRAVQYDFDAYRRTGDLLTELAAAGTRVVCSHDAVGETELLT